MNVHCFWQNAPLSPLHGIQLIQFTEVHEVCLATYISKMHKPKELLNLRHCFASVVIGFYIPNILSLPLLLYIITCIFLYSSTSSSSHLIFLTSVMCIKCTFCINLVYVSYSCCCAYLLLREIMKVKSGVIRMFS